MEAKFVDKIILLFNCIFLLFLVSGLHAQSDTKIYFLITKNDTLIKKQIATKEKEFEGYLIIDEQRVKPLNKTPIVEDKVWIPESDDDFYTFGPTFKFIRKNDKIITKEEFIKMNVIKNRKEFLHKFSSNFNNSETSYFFIEPINCSSNYILRKVSPVIFE